MKTGHEFTYKGVTFKVLKNGKNAIMLDAKSDFYDCESVEVWHKRYSKDRFIFGKLVKGGLRKPSNEDYPNSAHQFMVKHFKDRDSFLSAVEKRFNEYEEGDRPINIIKQ